MFMFLNINIPLPTTLTVCIRLWCVLVCMGTFIHEPHVVCMCACTYTHTPHTERHMYMCVCLYIRNMCVEIYCVVCMSVCVYVHVCTHVHDEVKSGSPHLSPCLKQGLSSSPLLHIPHSGPGVSIIFLSLSLMGKMKLQILVLMHQPLHGFWDTN